MFSLIITIIAIALVAALAVASIYYGGDAFNVGTGKARAAQYMNEGQQISAAVSLYKTDNAGAYPANIDVLVEDNYLAASPGGEWAFDANYVTRTGLSEAECTEANESVGQSGAPLCYGDDGVAGTSDDAGPEYACCSMT